MHAAVLLYFACAVLLLHRAGYPRRLTFDILQDNLRGWILFADSLLLAYAVVNFVVCLQLMGNGGADIVNGAYVLTSHGRVLSHLTQGEYHLHKAYELRYFSGGWLLFWAWSTSYFVFWKHVPIRSTDRLLA
jgi:hypothetical protein